MGKVEREYYKRVINSFYDVRIRTEFSAYLAGSRAAELFGDELSAEGLQFLRDNLNDIMGSDIKYLMSERERELEILEKRE